MIVGVDAIGTILLCAKVGNCYQIFPETNSGISISKLGSALRFLTTVFASFGMGSAALVKVVLQICQAVYVKAQV